MSGKTASIDYLAMLSAMINAVEAEFTRPGEAIGMRDLSSILRRAA